MQLFVFLCRSHDAVDSEAKYDKKKWRKNAFDFDFRRNLLRPLFISARIINNNNRNTI